MVTFYVLYSSTVYVTSDTGAMSSAEFSQQCVVFGHWEMRILALGIL